MTTRWFLPGGLLMAALVAAGFGYREHVALNTLRAQILTGELYPMATILKENYALSQELGSAAFTEPDYGILESYLAKIRRDGIPKHTAMKQRLDMLAENNAAIVALITVYAPHAHTAAFNLEADKFRNYASAWRDRWNSVMELFMAGGNYPATDVPFGAAFPAAVEAEIAAATRASP